MRPAPRADLEEELVDQELFLRDPISGEIHCLNGGAAVVWLLCDGSRDLAAIAEAIGQEYSQPESAVMEHVRDSVRRFAELDLLIDG